MKPIGIKMFFVNSEKEGRITGALVAAVSGVPCVGGGKGCLDLPIEKTGLDCMNEDMVPLSLSAEGKHE